MEDKEIKTESWEDRFDEKFDTPVIGCAYPGQVFYDETPISKKVTELKDFIREELKEEREKAIEETFTEVKEELQKPRFNTSMTGWQIVPRLVAIMELLERKYLTKKESE